MKYLLVLNNEKDVDVYKIENIDDHLLIATIEYILGGYGVPPEMNNYYDNTLPYKIYTNERGKFIQLTDDHPYSLCNEVQEYHN